MTREMLSGLSGRQHLSSAGARLAKVAVVVVALAAGFVSYWLSNLETRWIVYILIAQVGAVIALVMPVRDLALTAFVLTLQLNVLYFITPPVNMYVGQSGRAEMSVALVSLPAAVLLLYHLISRSRLSTGQRKAVRQASIPIAALIVAMLVSALHSTVRFQGFCTLVELLQLALIFLAAAVCVRSRRDVTIVYNLLMATVVLQSFVYFIESALGITFSAAGRVMAAVEEGGVVRPGGTIGSVPDDFASFVQPLLLCVVAAFVTAPDRRHQRAQFVLLMLGTTALFLTLSRTTWVDTFIGFAIVFFLLKRNGLVSSAAGRAAGRGLAAVGLGASMIAAPVLAKRLNGHAFGDDWQERIDLMKVALRMIADNPIFGVGPGGYPYNMGRYLAGVRWVYVVHNEYLMRWADLGIVGLLAWGTWLVSGFRRALRCVHCADPLIRNLSVGFVVGLILRLWDWMWWSHPTFSTEALYWFLFGLLVACERLARETADAKSTVVTPVIRVTVHHLPSPQPA